MSPVYGWRVMRSSRRTSQNALLENSDKFRRYNQPSAGAKGERKDMPLRLALRFLGPPQIHLENEPIPLERRKALALLAYLAVEQGEHSRESLSALLWPDYCQSNAFKDLRQILWGLQKILGEGRLLIDREKIGLNGNTGHVWLDVREFESRLIE